MPNKKIISDLYNLITEETPIPEIKTESLVTECFGSWKWQHGSSAFRINLYKAVWSKGIGLIWKLCGLGNKISEAQRNRLDYSGNVGALHGHCVNKKDV